MQSLVNLVYGIAAGAGLYFLGVPYRVGLGGAGCGSPIHPVRRAGARRRRADPGQPGGRSRAGPVRSRWSACLSCSSCSRISSSKRCCMPGRPASRQVALLVSVAFWTWLWGPLGLLMATPLTVCLVVLGKHVPGLEFVGTLMADTPALAAEYGYYQRLLARDQSEAADLIERHIKTEPPRSVYDALLLPALNYAERDRLEQRLSPDEETAVIDATRELLVGRRGVDPSACNPEPPASPDGSPLPGPREPLRVLGYATNGVADELALAMLAHLLDDLPIAVEMTAARLQASELVSLVQERGFSVVCFADLPPSPPSKTRYLVKRLRAALPEVRILVGRWAPPALADESTQVLRETGANLVALDAAGDPRLSGRAGGDPADSRSEDNVAHAA